MSTPHRTRLVNPHLGVYFGIFVSAFAGLFFVLLILEQLHVAQAQLQPVALIAPVLLFAAIGVASFTREPGEYFAAGRRVPAVYNGLAFAIGAIGGTGLVTLAGLFFLNGFDAWFVGIGLSSGFLVSGIAIAPYLRKFGAYTVPSYLARRMESRLIRIVAATVFAVPMLMLLAAEFRIAVHAAALLTGYSQSALALFFTAALLVTMVFGGMRAIGWVSTAQALAAIIALVVLAGVIGVSFTNLPLAQFSYGPTLRHIGRLELAQNITAPPRALFELALAGQGLEALSQPMAAPFASSGWAGFVGSALIVMMGIAAAPWLLPRCATTLGVYEARKSLGWAIFLAGVVVLTLSALAVFLRATVMTQLVGRSSEQLPGWFSHLVERGLAGLAKPGVELPLSSYLFARDGILYAVPLAMDLPAAAVYLVLAGVIAAALAGALATAFSLSAILSEDVVNGLNWSPPTDAARVSTARFAAATVVVVGLAFHSTVAADPLELFLSALTLSAASAFPVVVLSIWWKRLSIAGAVSSMAVGFGTTVAMMSASAAGAVDLATPVIGLVATPLAITAALVVSLLTPMPAAGALDVARDMRIPGGETVYDREMRQLRFTRRGAE